MTDTSFIFVADGPRFEDPAVILAGSIRVQHGDAAAIHAYCPEEKAQALSAFFRAAMAELGVQISPIPAGPSPFAEPYPHGNKILAAAQPRSGARTVFLDTDTVLLAPLVRKQAQTLVAAVPEGVPTWGRHTGDWAPVYAHFGLPLPDARVRLCRGRRIEVLPYFNAGFLSFPEHGSHGQRFGKLWLETAAEIDHRLDIPNKRPWLDQIALPIAIARSQFGWEAWPEKFNYSLYRRQFPIEADRALVHYHLPSLFRADIGCMRAYRSVLRLLPAELARELRQRAPAFEMPGRGRARADFMPVLDLDAPDQPQPD